MALKATELLKNITSSTKVLQVDSISDLSSALTADFAQKSELSSKANESDLSVLSSQVNPANQSVTPASGYYNCYDTKLNAIGQVVDGTKICLKDYSFSKGYAIKFSTPENQEVHLQFYKDEGSGQVLMTGSINEKYAFPMNSSYVIEVKFENIDVRPDGWTGNRQKMTFRTIEWSEED